jgi:hypothetical protein
MSNITPSDPNVTITYGTSPADRLDKLVTRLEKVFAPDLTEAQRQAQYIAVWHSGDDDDAYESIDWEFVIRTLSTTA